jgi:tetratricopeptide (TPR) repeat protein
VAANPQLPAWRAALATLLCEAGGHDEARHEFELLAADGFTGIPQDGDWMIAITLLADSCTELGDAERAARLYALLLPYRDSNVVIGIGAACLGSAARYLGRLATTIGERTAAVEHLRRALARNAARKAPVHVAHTQLDYASALGPGREARELIEAAAQTAEELDLAKVARRAAELRTP